MNGEKLIDWAIRRCKEEGLEPTDANILLFIREWDESEERPCNS